MQVRTATESDSGAINTIYNHYVRTCTCTYQEDPDSLQERREWFQHHDDQHPVIVAEADGQVVRLGIVVRVPPALGLSAYRRNFHLRAP
ncbi:MAG TPA: hypothetical protein VN625_09410 [Desulfuromonadaceae bacterium]|nr:hypothetical protein [Desulfuromonadaceae bacterium]